MLKIITEGESLLSSNITSPETDSVILVDHFYTIQLHQI